TDLANRFDGVPHRLADFVIDDFALFSGSVIPGRSWRRVHFGRRCRLLRRFWAWNSGGWLGVWLAFVLFLLAAHNRALRVIVFRCLFDLLKTHAHGYLRSNFSLTDGRFQNLDDFRREFVFQPASFVKLVAGQ